MSIVMSDRERIAEADLRALVMSALTKIGASPTEARDTAEILVLADLMGIHTHGASRVESYGERLKTGGIKAHADITVESVSPTILRVDGDNGLGPAIGLKALDAALRAAKQHGVATAFCRGSNHFGAITPYAWLAAQQGCACIIASNATTTITPSGGSEARLGNNPLGFGFPNPGGDPMILDMAMSVVARAKIRDAADAGKPIPEGWATDIGGRPTTDPNLALKGFLLPIGGYKGYGLSLAVDMLVGVLSGAAYLTHVKSWVDSPDEPQNLGHAFIVIDVERLGTRDWLAERVADFREQILATPLVDPEQPILLPGQREMERMREQRATGIRLGNRVLQKITNIANDAA